jgi:hypothetical protein
VQISKNNLQRYTKECQKANPFGYLFIIQMQNIWNNNSFLQKTPKGNIKIPFSFQVAIFVI